ncbi:MAG: ATP-binding protein [Bauldia sp.]
MRQPRLRGGDRLPGTDVVGRKPFFWKLAPQVVDEIWAAALAGLDWHGEFDNIRKDGTLLSVSATVSPVADEDGRISHVIAIEEDITRRREVEAQLRQAQKMEAVGNLTGGMAHDFNNLLAVVIGNLDILCGRREQDPDVQELAREALDAAVHGADLTRRLLAFARRQPLQPQQVDPNELITGTVKLLRRMLDAGIEIPLALAPEVWSVVVDPAQLAASITNLATNARDAMPGGGRLAIATANAVVDAGYAAAQPSVKPGEYVVITVSDSGSGIPPEAMAHIFEPFFTTKEQGKGQRSRG